MRLNEISRNWVAQNPWIDANQTLHDMMIECHHAVIRKYPDMPMGETYDRAKALLIDRLEYYLKSIKMEGK